MKKLFLLAALSFVAVSYVSAQLKVDSTVQDPYPGINL